jgi:hypothetical protein
MFPRHYVVIVDRHFQAVDFRLYEHEQDARQAYQTWRNFNGRQRWEASPGDIRRYKRPDLSIGIGWLDFKTFHGLSDDDLKERAGGFLPFEVLTAAREYERRSLENDNLRKSYYFNRFRYLVWAASAVIAVSFLIYVLRRYYVSDPIPHLSLSITIIGFGIVGYFLYREFGSRTAGILGGAALWAIWGLLLSAFVGAPLFGW